MDRDTKIGNLLFELTKNHSRRRKVRIRSKLKYKFGVPYQAIEEYLRKNSDEEDVMI